MIIKNPNHVHTHDAKDKITCCTLDDIVYSKAGEDDLLNKIKADDSKPVQNTIRAESSLLKQYLPAIISLLMLLIGIATDNYFKPTFFTGNVRLVWYAIAYLPVGFPVIKEGWSIIFSSQTGQPGMNHDGTTTLDFNKEVFRVIGKAKKSKTMNEQLVYKINEKGFVLSWENLDVIVPMK